MIYIIEGVDGTGKTTLANEIVKQKNAAFLHCSFNSRWGMRAYHEAMIRCAEDLNDNGIDVVLDRWAPSEKVYGNIYRSGQSYDTDDIIKYYYKSLNLPITWVYCKNDNAVINHLKNVSQRDEMFDGDKFEDLVNEFDGYIQGREWMNWVIYDFDTYDVSKFVKEML